MLREGSERQQSRAGRKVQPRRRRREIPRAKADLRRPAASSQPRLLLGTRKHPQTPPRETGTFPLRTVPVSPRLGTPLGTGNSRRVSGGETQDILGSFLLSIPLVHPGLLLEPPPLFPAVLEIKRVQEVGMLQTRKVCSARGSPGPPGAQEMEPQARSRSRNPNCPKSTSPAPTGDSRRGLFTPLHYWKGFSYIPIINVRI